LVSFEDVKFGFVPPQYPLDLILETSLYSEKKGLDSIWMADHTVGIGIKNWDFYEAWSVLSALAVQTKNILLGTCVSDPHRRHPAVLAQTLMTLDHLSKGRAMLGLGAGEAMNLVPYHIAWDHPVTRLREAAEVIIKLLTEDFSNYEGKFFQLEKAFIRPKAVQNPHPPIYFGANSPKTMRICAELGDGWIPVGTFMKPQDYKAKFEKIRKMAKEAGRDPEKIEPAMFNYMVVAKDYDTAFKLVEFPAKMLLAGSYDTLKEYGVEPPKMKLDVLHFVFNPDTMMEAAGEVMKMPIKPIEDRFIFGSPDDCIDKIAKYVEGGVRHFAMALYVPSRLNRETLELFVEKVVPYFRR
jgi:alkanesulfonate monooxygenase SsuD/methylene tetrahydromethanopterin reductase-like flavin-dependent oxidoreductase (luciferase family)